MRALRRSLVGIATIALLLAVLAGGTYLVAGHRLTRQFTVDAQPVAEPSPQPSADSAVLARGAHLAGALGKCADCHGDDFGGKTLVDDPGLGRLSAPNLTRGRGGVTADFTLADWDRALRHGVRPDGSGLVFMPSEDYAAMSDADLLALVAYMRQLAPVDRDVPRPAIRLVGRALYMAGKLPLLSAERIDHAMEREEVAAGPTVEYGAYLADISGCRGCHGPQLSGGPIPGMPPGTPPAANLTPTGLGRYTEADFTRAMREGVRPDGTAMSEVMPVRFTRQMTDDEIVALYRFLRTVEPREFGGR